MPLGDGTGPAGMGPMTGRAAGYCAGYPVPGYLHPYGGRFAHGSPYGYTAPYPADGYPAAPYGPAGYPAAPYGLVGFPGYGAFWGRGRRFGRGFGFGFGRGGGRGRGRFWW